MQSEAVQWARPHVQLHASQPWRGAAAAAPAPTTIAALDDDLLREIFLRLPGVTSLARAAFACRAFLRAVRSSPAFRRRFRELHAPPLLALFLTPYMYAVVPAAPDRRSSVPVPDSDTAAAFADLLQDEDGSEWWTDSRTQSRVPYSEGYVAYVHRATGQDAYYSPHSRALKIYPKEPHGGGGGGGDTCLQFYALSPDGEPEQRASRVLCVHHERSWAWARVAVFSSRTMEWKIFPEAGPLLPEEEGNIFTGTTGTVVNGFICWEICWVHELKRGILALDTATFQFSRMDLPLPLIGPRPHQKFKLGQTNAGKLCIVSVHEFKLYLWLQTAGDDGVNKFVLHKAFPLHTSVKGIIEDPEDDKVAMEAKPMEVIDGFVYLSVVYWWEPHSPQWFLSFCLETAEVNLLLKESRHLSCPFDPYIMTRWPSSLIHNKWDPETGVTGELFEDDGPTGTEEASPLLFAALQSFKEALIDDENTGFAEINAFLLDDEKNSLLNKISNLESILATTRDRVLRLGAGSSDREGVERGSSWQTLKGRLGRACPQFLLLVLAFFLAKTTSFLMEHAATEG